MNQKPSQPVLQPTSQPRASDNQATNQQDSEDDIIDIMCGSAFKQQRVRLSAELNQAQSNLQFLKRVALAT